MGLFAGLVRHLLPLVPKPIVARVASRYVAGAEIEDALRIVRDLNASGAQATIDILGESVKEAGAAQAAVFQYLELMEGLRKSGLQSSVSIKPTMLGLNLSPAYAEANIDALYEAAASNSVFITIDMEDHTCTDETLRIYGAMLASHGNAGCVLQAYLRRTLSDIEVLPLPGEGKGRGDVRLCKGIYIESEEIAYKPYQEVRDNFLRCFEALVHKGHYVGIATHDEWLIDQCLVRINSRPIPKDRYEFQMLLGVKPQLRRRLIEAGHSVRVYVPYGRDWHPYSIRRLRENPAVAWHVLKAMLGFGG